MILVSKRSLINVLCN